MQVDVAQGHGDLDVAAFVEILEGDREGLEGFAPQLVDAFFAGAVQHEAPEAERLLQTSAAFAHQRVVGLDFDADGLQFDQLGEDVGGPVEEGAGEHGALDPAPLGFGFGFVFVALAGFVEPAAGNVEAVFDVVEEAAGEGADQLALGLQGVFGNGVGLEPVARVEDPLTAVDDLLPCAFRGVVVPWSALG
jgi:hypothetical protein